MQMRTLGRSGITIAPLVLGGNVFGWTADEAISMALLDRFVERGFNAIDTADLYAAWAGKGGESERIIGRWLKRRGRRDDVIIMTKVGMWDQRPGLRAKNIQAAAEDSLKRLQTDFIDVYFTHKDDPDTPLGETLTALTKLVEAGKVRVIGASNYSASRLADALRTSDEHQLAKYHVLQPNYNLYDRSEYESDLQRVAIEERLGVVPYFSLAAGFLTGKYRSEKDLEGRARGGKVRGYLNERGYRILAALDSVAESLNATPAQVSLAWLLTRPGVTAPIVSATSVQQLEEVLAAASLDLPEDALRELDQASVW